MSDQFNIFDWYWDVGDTFHGASVWASARDAYVALADATYVAWLANGNSPTVIDTQLNLALAFDSVAETIGRIARNSLTGANITLTNPLPRYQEVNSSTGKVFLPFVLDPAAWPRSQPFWLKNIHTTVTLTVYAVDTTTVIGTLSPGEFGFAFLRINNDNTGVGQWSLYHIPAVDLGAITEIDIPGGSAVALTTSTSANVTSLTLGAGEWDISGAVYFASPGATTVDWALGCYSLVSATFDASNGRYGGGRPANTLPVDFPAVLPTCRFSLGGSTTIYLIALAAFTVSTLKAYGHMHAVRVK